MPTLPPPSDHNHDDETPPLLPTPKRYRRQLGPHFWPWPPSRRKTPSLRVGATIGAVTVTAQYWVPSQYSGRRSERWVELRCACGRGERWVTRAHNVTSNGDLLACDPCILARQRSRAGAKHPNWRGIGRMAGSHFASIRADARKRGLGVDLTDAELAAQYAAQGGRCAYTGVALVSTAKLADRTASLERLDDTRPYEAGNIVFIHKELNVMRRTLRLARFVAIAEAVAAYDGIPRTTSPACLEDIAPPPAPVLLARRRSLRDARGKVRAIGRYRCGRCGADFVARMENVATGNTRSCGCYGNAIRGIATRHAPERHGPIRATYLHGLARMAGKRGRQLAVSPEYLRDLFLAQRGTCALTGWPLDVRGRRGRASLDRIDPDRGYVAGNLQWTHPEVNLCKHRQQQADFLRWATLIAAHLGRRWRDRHVPPTASTLSAWATAAGDTRVGVDPAP